MVGGFLGAGKTTLLARATEILVGRGMTVGLITNDQAGDLVDTAMLRTAGFRVSEIDGGCFCCRFENLISVSDRLIEQIQPDVLIGEPVGSCTDLSATVLQPLKKYHGQRFRVAPLTVLADPARLRQTLRPDRAPIFPNSITYILRKQLEEADLILINKADTLEAAETAELVELAERAFGARPVRTVSALTGAGVGDWLDQLTEERPAGKHVAEVDYDTYAEGEALLGWLNGSVALHGEKPVDWPALCGDLLERIRTTLAAKGAEVAHLKLFLSSPCGSVVANLTGAGAPISVRPEISGHSGDAELTLNARVHVDPKALQQIVRAALETIEQAGTRVTIRRMASFRPGRPEPVHRFDAPV